MKIALTLLLFITLSVAAHGSGALSDRISAAGDPHKPPAQVQPDDPDTDNSFQHPVHWKQYWTPVLVNVQFQTGHLVASHNDDPSDSPCNTYATRDKSGGSKQKS